MHHGAMRPPESQVSFWVGMGGVAQVYLIRYPVGHDHPSPGDDEAVGMCLCVWLLPPWCIASD